MTARIYIIHSSEIVRKGLLAVIRNQFQLEVVEISDAQALQKEDVAEDEYCIVFAENSLFEAAKLETILSEQGKNFHLIAISIKGADKKENPVINHNISLETSAIDIVKIVKEAIKKNDVVETVEHEGEELSQREKEVLKLVALGFANKNIAEKLFISIHTVISHRKNITEKLGIKSISGLTVYAILNNFIDTSEINPEDLF